jgi:hypothetical protein
VHEASTTTSGGADHEVFCAAFLPEASMNFTDWIGVILLLVLVLFAGARAARRVREGGLPMGDEGRRERDTDPAPEGDEDLDAADQAWLLRIAPPAELGEGRRLVTMARGVLLAHEEDLRSGRYEAVARAIVDTFRLGPAVQARMLQFAEHAEEVRAAARAAPCAACGSEHTKIVRYRPGLDAEQQVLCDRGHTTTAKT